MPGVTPSGRSVQTEGMTVRVELFLGCDVWRSYSCAGRTSLLVEKDAIAKGEARLRRRAREEEGWTQEPGPAGALLDACPACSYARFAAEVAGIDPPPSRPEYRPPHPPLPEIPATIGEAAERNRRRSEAHQ